MEVRFTPNQPQICDYTQEVFGAAQSRRAAVAIYDSADSLKYAPYKGRSGRKPGTRELIISGFPFVVIYRAGKEAVEILRILHGSRQWR